jgi:hypothetical protein
MAMVSTLSSILVKSVHDSSVYENKKGCWPMLWGFSFHLFTSRVDYDTVAIVRKPHNEKGHLIIRFSVHSSTVLVQGFILQDKNVDDICGKSGGFIIELLCDKQFFRTTNGLISSHDYIHKNGGYSSKFNI